MNVIYFNMPERDADGKPLRTSSSRSDGLIPTIASLQRQEFCRC